MQAPVLGEWVVPMFLTVSPAVPMASNIPTLAAGSMTVGSLVMPGRATDRTTHVLISACKQLSMRRTAQHETVAESQDREKQGSGEVPLNHVASHECLACLLQVRRLLEDAMCRTSVKDAMCLTSMYASHELINR